MGGIGDDSRTARIASTRAFFAPRAAGWEDRFPDDGPRYARALADLEPPVGGTVVDAACGTGRALPALRAAVGPAGTVIGVDLTTEMLAEAARRGRRSVAALLLADAMTLPFATGSLDAVFAAGLLPHLADPDARRLDVLERRLTQRLGPVTRATRPSRGGRRPPRPCR